MSLLNDITRKSDQWEEKKCEIQYKSIERTKIPYKLPLQIYFNCP